MLRLTLLLALPLFAACEQSSSPPKKPLTTTMALEVHWASAEDIAGVAKSYGDPTADREGYAVLKGTGTAFTCDIYVPESVPDSVVAQQLIGHELMHCLYGNYHAEP